MIFVDEVRLRVRGGRGGDGCMAFRREKFVPRGGPAGGDGGDGGAVLLVAEPGLNTLHHLRFQELRVAERGRHGEGSNRTGRSGADLEIPVPPGTRVWLDDGPEPELVGELLAAGDRLEVAAGGRGGRGNARFATPTNRAPRRADPGEEPEERALRLELALLADVGLVGLPNAGKSTLIGVVSAARPKVADYPFTTLVPALGVVAGDPDEEPFVVADLPGLIAGASEGAGLGHRFLRHVQRCRVLAHLVDLSQGEAAADEDLATTERELEAFDPDLLRRARIVVGTKLDVADPERRRDLAAAAAARRLAYHEVSAVRREGVAELTRALRRRLEETPAS